MGTDIHVYAEFRNNAGQWEVIPDYEPFQDRNKKVFSFFSEGFDSEDYNWLGFRIVYPHPIINEPRGLPEDVSQFVKAESDEWGTGAFGRSWLSVDELVSYDYTKPLRDRTAELVDVPEESVKLAISETLGEKYF
ncbi:hypothetical protein, partial [Endozoicomonas sp. ONNA2]|uniref:hypothetical protein n=1 Tax=Endozoicomonas sp. ONNA2 TaxID=2828741 RepID=UPI0021483C9E